MLLYHGDAYERQCSHLHMVRKEGKGKAADNQTTSSDLQIYMANLLAAEPWPLQIARNGLMAVGSGHGSAAKGQAIDLEVAGCGLVGCHFPFPPLSLPCSSKCCLSYTI